MAAFTTGHSGASHDGRPAVVYYMLKHGEVKIGTTVNLLSRAQNIRPDQIVAAEPGSYHLEALRHEQFQVFRTRRSKEWFSPAPSLAAHIFDVIDAHGAVPGFFIAGPRKVFA